MITSRLQIADIPTDIAKSLVGMLGSLSRYTMHSDGSVSVTCLTWSARIRVNRSRTKLVMETSRNLSLDIPLEVPLVEDGVSVCADILRHDVPTLVGDEVIGALRGRAGLMGIPVRIDERGLSRVVMTAARGQVVVSHSQGRLTYEPRGRHPHRIPLPTTAALVSSLADDIVQVLSGRDN